MLADTLGSHLDSTTLINVVTDRAYQASKGNHIDPGITDDDEHRQFKTSTWPMAHTLPVWIRGVAAACQHQLISRCNQHGHLRLHHPRHHLSFYTLLGSGPKSLQQALLLTILTYQSQGTSFKF